MILRKYFPLLILSSLVVSCTVSNPTITNVKGVLYLEINDRFEAHIEEIGNMDIDTSREVSKFTMWYSKDLDKDNKLGITLDLFLKSIDHKLAVRSYKLDEFFPNYHYIKYEYDKEGYRPINYNPIFGDLSITEFDSINPHKYVVSGTFNFACTSPTKIDTVAVSGFFRNVQYNYYYRDIIFKK